MATDSPSDVLRTSLKEYFKNSQYTDLIIRCEGQEFKVHKLVICGQSRYFSKACDGDWKEAADGVIELKEDDVRVVQAMLHFMYGFDYDGSGTDQGRVSPMLFNTKVYALADKYEVLALKSRALEKFEEAVKTCWNMDDFAHVANEAYTSTPPADQGLRNIVAEVANEHIQTLLEKPDFQAILEETSGFAADIVRLMANGKGGTGISKYRCPSCGNDWRGEVGSGRTYYCVLCAYASTTWKNYVVA